MGSHVLVTAGLATQHVAVDPVVFQLKQAVFYQPYVCVLTGMNRFYVVGMCLCVHVCMCVCPHIYILSNQPVLFGFRLGLRLVRMVRG